MDKHRAHAVASWAKFLNPETLRANLITASIFLAAYETLRASVIDNIRGFFTNRFDENGLIVSNDYRTRVLSLDKSPLRASLLWFKQMGAVDDNNTPQVNRIREHRNEGAHGLPKFIATADSAWAIC